jgi:predicted glutamine amidotransferase
MCRFLLASSEEKMNPKQLLETFAQACEKSIAPNGDLQEDGWGVAWLDKNNKWHSKKSLHPIWKDTDSFSSVPETRLLVVHARSATFPKEKGEITYNQPYISGNYCFVFNGALKGVTLTRPIPGKIGAQKIWWLLKEALERNSVADSLNKLKNFLEMHSREVTALNVGIATPDVIAAMCNYAKHPDYYSLNYADNGVKIICSEEIQGFNFNKIKKNELKKFEI